MTQPHAKTPTTPDRGASRHRLKRSLTEFTPPGKLHLGQLSSDHQEHHQYQQTNVHGPSSRNRDYYGHLHRPHFRKGRHHEERVPHSAHPASQLRHSIDMTRSNGSEPLFDSGLSREASVNLPDGGKRKASVDAGERRRAQLGAVTKAQ